MGGQSGEREVSVNSGKTVVRELSGRYALKPVEILSSGRWLVPAGYIGGGIAADPLKWFNEKGKPILEGLDALRKDGVDAVFNALHGPLGEDGSMQGLFRMLELPLTGPDVIPAAVTIDKHLTKQVLLAGGVSTPRSFIVRSSLLRRGKADWRSLVKREEERLPFPWVLKPNRLGSSVGVAIFRDAESLFRQASDLIASWPESSRSDDLLVEEAVKGRELTCGVIETGEQAFPLPPIEIRPHGHEFFDYHAKYTPGASEEICPAPISTPERAAVTAAALKVHALFDCAPLSRTDLFLTPDGRVEVLEVNTLPGLTATSLIPLSASKAGIPLSSLFSDIVEHALARAEDQGWLRRSGNPQGGGL
jgi:D-alanine--D-alanine ligase